MGVCERKQVSLFGIIIVITSLSRAYADSWIQLGMQSRSIRNETNHRYYRLHRSKNINKNVVDNSYKKRKNIYGVGVYNSKFEYSDADYYGNAENNYLNYLNNDEVLYNYSEDNIPDNINNNNNNYNSYYYYENNSALKAKKRHVSNRSSVIISNANNTNINKNTNNEQNNRKFNMNNDDRSRDESDRNYKDYQSSRFASSEKKQLKKQQNPRLKKQHHYYQQQQKQHQRRQKQQQQQQYYQQKQQQNRARQQFQQRKQKKSKGKEQRHKEQKTKQRGQQRFLQQKESLLYQSKQKKNKNKIINDIFTNLCKKQQEMQQQQQQQQQQHTENLPKFSDRNICSERDNEMLSRALRESSLDGLLECRRQFEGERWGCELSGSGQEKLSQLLNLGTKEAAFIHAITSSSLVHKLTTFCSKGLLDQCSCDASQKSISSRDEAWRWGGCSDDVEYGAWLSRLLIDSQEMKAFKEEEEEEENDGSDGVKAKNDNKSIVIPNSENEHIKNDLEKKIDEKTNEIHDKNDDTKHKNKTFTNDDEAEEWGEVGEVGTDGRESTRGFENKKRRKRNNKHERNTNNFNRNYNNNIYNNNQRHNINNRNNNKNKRNDNNIIINSNNQRNNIKKEKKKKSGRLGRRRVLREVEQITRSLLNMHNNQVGRKTMSSMMSHSCRCHGVSGSCAVRTCWRALPALPKVGDLLKLKYQTSVAITPPPLFLLVDKNKLGDKKTIEKKLRRSLNGLASNNTENELGRPWQRRPRRRRTQLEKKKNRPVGSTRYSSIKMAKLKRFLTTTGANLTTLASLYNKRREKRKSRDSISDNELVFVSKSPNFCRQNFRLGIPGTRGRRCVRGQKGSSGCGHLCCGRGYSVLVERRIEACECKFVWCCEVVCKQCEVVEEIPVCN